MTARDATTAFAAFREVVFGDFRLLMRLRPPLARDAYVEQVVAIGAEHGFVFDEAAVRAALREGEEAWLLQGAEVMTSARHSGAAEANPEPMTADVGGRGAAGPGPASERCAGPGRPRRSGRDDGNGALTAADRLFGWTPFRAAFRGDAMWVDWCHLDTRRMVEPFFYETVLQAMREPFNLVFQQRTPIEALAELPSGLPVAGFVFHMSRCGSTLIAQALAAFESNIVVSEAAPLRSVLQAAFSGRVTRDAVAAWLAGLINAFAQPRFADEARLVVKFMAADMLDIGLVRRAFPDVPWIVVTRDPAEILASQAESPGIDLLRGQIAPSRLDLADEALWTMEDTAYQAHVLAALAGAARAAHSSGRGLIVDHSDLPDALWTKVAPHFGLAPDAGAIELMRAVSRRHSKRPADVFAADRDPNRMAAAPFRTIVEPITGDVMTALAALRRPA